MGLLDDLKNEAEKKEAAKQQEQAQQLANEEFYEQKLKPLMRRAHDYLSELVETLNTVAPEVRAPYPVDPARNEPIGLLHGPYSFRSDSYDNPRKILIACDCELKERREFYVQTKGAVARYAALLEEHKFPYYTKKELDKSHDVINAHFILEGPLRVQIRIQASVDERCIYIDLLNLGLQPVKRYKMGPEKVTDELLDRLARMLVREESQLVEVQVSAETREQLRRKLAEERQRLAEGQAKADAAIEAERRAEEEARLINRARRSVSDRFKKILSKDD